MAAWTLADARTRLQMWLDAETAVAHAQEYSIGGMRLTRADAGHIAKQIAFWRREVERLESPSRRRRRRRLIPMDS